MKVYGVHELAVAVNVPSDNVSMWLLRGNREMPKPDARLACGPVWVDSAELRAWIRRTRRELKRRARRREMLALRRAQEDVL